MKNKLLFIVLGFLIFSSLITVSCSGETTSATTSPATTVATKTAAETTAAEYGGILKIENIPTVFDMNINKLTAWSSYEFARPAVEPLVSFDQSGSGAVIPCLATGWQFNADYTSITFTLRKGVKFHDGTDFNAQAAQYCLNQVMNSPVSTELKSVSSIDVVDDYTIRLNLNSYSPSFLSNLVGAGTMMISPTYLKTLDKNAWTSPVGTGPYKFVSYKQDSQITFERFDGYWGGKPYLDGIEWELIQDPMTSLLSLKAGQANVWRGLSANNAQDLKATGNYNVWVVIGGASFGLAGDSKHPNSPFANIKVRQAVAYAIDREAVTNSMGKGFYPSLNQVYPAGGYAYNPTIVGYPYNLQKAKSLLSEAGYPNGFKTSILYESVERYQTLFTAVQSYLNAAGITTELNPVDRAGLTQARANGWNNSLIEYLIPTSAGMNIGAQLIRGLSTQATNYKDIDIPADYMNKLLLANPERDPQKRQAMFQELVKVIIDDYCMFFPIYSEGNLVAASSKTHNVDLEVYSGQEWHPEKAWMSK